jgi:hypothetical protein
LQSIDPHRQRRRRIGDRPVHAGHLPVVATLLAFFLTPLLARGLDVVPQDRQLLCGSPCSLEIPVLVAGSAALDAVGFDLLFDGAKLEYRSVRRGPFVRHWAAFGAELLPGARVRVGGFDASPFVLAGSETLAVLSFVARTPSGCTTYRTDQLVDDLAAAPARAGFASWGGWEYPANGYVALYPSGQPPACCYDTPNGTVLAVVAHTAGASAAGILGAEFRVEISPPAAGATLTWTPDAWVASAVGDPVDNSVATTDSSGVWLGFASCRVPYEMTVSLGTLTVAGLTGGHDLLVKRHNHPADSHLPCAQWTLCEDVTCGVACLARTLTIAEDPVVFRARVNDPACATVGCGFVPVAPRAWTDIKRLYR